MSDFLKVFLLVVVGLSIAAGLLFGALWVIVWLNFVGGLWLSIPVTIVFLALFLTGFAFLLEGW